MEKITKRKKFRLKVLIMAVLGYVIPIMIYVYVSALFTNFFIGIITNAAFFVYLIYFSKYIINKTK